MSEKYNPKVIENKWRSVWETTGIYKTEEDSKKPKFYALDMFPYPSGVGLHVGHPKGYIATDVFSRMKTLQGYNVLHPMGWDAFGLPAENYALKNKVHPKKAVDENVKKFKKQLEVLGFNYDWNREINTTNPEYYRWTQWIFLKLFEKGLAYESDEPINWCPSCKTGLAQEDLEGNVCERCGSEVEKKPIRQWVLKMTDYADRLLYDLDNKDFDWEEQIKEQQRNWIGRSEGALIKFKIKNEKLKINSKDQNSKTQNSDSGQARMTESGIEVFTTRVDTIFGCTYMVVAPEHPILDSITTKEQRKEVEKYKSDAIKKSEIERQDDKEKTGVFTGLYAVNPFNGEEVPIWVADYVLMNYGTGAVMAVPAHDERDWEFAENYDLKVNPVIEPFNDSPELTQMPLPELSKKERSGDYPSLEETRLAKYEAIKGGQMYFTGDGKLTNSGEFTGLTSEDAKVKMADWLEKKKIGSRKVNYKLRDWVFSRQRYWGEPIPIIHCEECGVVPVPENELPVELPEVERYEPMGTGESPLAAIDEWVNTKCPKCGGKAKRETNTMPQWAGSCWYYLRYIDPKNDKSLVAKDKEKEWMPVDLYVGGAEHATRHLLYARFWHKFLYDINVVSTTEPFKRLVHVGLILAEDGRKMSKRWNNVINPDDIVNQFGADSMRIYEMFMGPFTKEVSWSSQGVKGVKRFLDKVWDLSQEIIEYKEAENSEDDLNSEKSIEETALARITNKTIKKVTEDIEDFKFNTAVSAMMECVNELIKIKEKLPVESSSDVWRKAIENLTVILSPFAPHMAEEIWEGLGFKESIVTVNWPSYNKDLIKEETVVIPVQVNGKVRDQILIDIGAGEEDVKKQAYESEKVQKYIDGKEIVKTVFVPGKLISIVVKG